MLIVTYNIQWGMGRDRRIDLDRIARTVAGADVIALVKPQFEAGRAEVKKGIIRDEAVHARVVEEVAASAAAIGLTRVADTPSPITGARGNREFFLHLRP